MRARALRANATDAERRLWSQLRNRQLAGRKFHRQHPIGPFIADFACLEARLVVEVDGGQHFGAEALQADAGRTEALKDAGLEALRFDNRQVLTQTEAVLAAIQQWLQGHDPHPNPLPQAGAGASRKESP